MPHWYLAIAQISQLIAQRDALQIPKEEFHFPEKVDQLVRFKERLPGRVQLPDLQAMDVENAVLIAGGRHTMLLIPQPQNDSNVKRDAKSAAYTTIGASSAKLNKEKQPDAEKQLLAQMKRMRYHVHAGVVLKSLVRIVLLYCCTELNSSILYCN